MNRFLITLGAGVLLSISAFSLYAAQDPGLPVTTHNGEQCYYYTSAGNESIFGIIKRFGWDEETFLKYNPGTAEIKKGRVLYYPIEATDEGPVVGVVDVEAPSTESAPETIAQETAPTPEAVAENMPAIPASPVKTIYKVPEGATLYQIAREQATSIEQILRMNPGVKPDRLTPGTEILITTGYPKPVTETATVTQKTVAGTRSYKAGQTDTWESVAAEARVPLELLLKVNPTSDQPLAKGNKIRIPLLKDTVVEKQVLRIDPREETPEGRRDIYNKVHRLPVALPLQVTVLTDEAPDSHKRDNEFVRGMLLAFNDMKASGLPVNLHVRRVGSAALTPEALTADSLLDVTDLIITTFDRDFPATLAEYADNGGKQIINVFDAKSSLYTESPSMIQVLPPSSDFFNACTDYLLAAKGDSKFLYVAEDEADGECVSLLLLERLIREGKIYETVPTYAEIAAYKYEPGQNYVIVSDLNKRADIASLLDDVAKNIDRNPGISITVVGRPTWIVYADALKLQMQKADTYIPSRFYMDGDNANVAAFDKSYAEAFKTAPLKSFPGYAAMGYDIARYTLPALINTRGDISEAPASTGALQLDLSLSRPQTWGGLLNTAVYLVHFTPYNTIDKLRL